MSTYVSIMGVTCTGKDTLVERMQQLWPDDIGLIQVGKEFRRRYPPEYFKGKAAMPHTEAESWSIFEEQKAAAADKPLVLVVSQPRMRSQLDEILKRVESINFYLLTCTDDELMRRINKRFEDQKEGWKTLALERVTNDKVQHFDLMVHMIQCGRDIESVYDTTDALDQVCESIYKRENKWA